MIGIVAGVLLAATISSRRAGIWRESSAAAVLAVVTIGYFSLDSAGGSGYLGAFLAGLIVGNMERLGLAMHSEHERELRQFAFSVADLVTLFVFVVLGANIPFDTLGEYLLPAFAVLATLLLLARPLTVLACTLPDRRGRVDAAGGRVPVLDARDGRRAGGAGRRARRARGARTSTSTPRRRARDRDDAGPPGAARGLARRPPRAARRRAARRGRAGRGLTGSRREARGVTRPSLVDATEAALRERLAPGRARPGDRLPPENELAETLGVSRGTLRLALERLETNGEIVRRQGSGTYVGRVALSPAFSEGLEVLESYASLARRQGKRLERPQPAGRAGADAGLRRRGARDPARHAGAADPAHAARRRRRWPRTCATSSTPRSTCRRPTSSARRSSRAGWSSTCCVDRGVPIAFARTQVRPRLVEPGGRLGEAMGATRVTAALEMIEVMHLAGGEAVQYSIDVFAPGSIDLHVIRGLESPGWQA